MKETARADQLDDFFLAEMLAQLRKKRVADTVWIDYCPIHQGSVRLCAE